MSIINSIGSKAVIGMAILAAGVGGVAVLANHNGPYSKMNDKVHSAIVNKDLTQYKAAQTETINQEKKAELDKVNSMTQEQFDTMADKHIKLTAARKAIADNDYEAFKANADDKMLSKITDQVSFDKMVANQKARAEHQAKVTEAVKTNNFDLFKQAISEREANHPKKDEDSSRPEPSEAELKTRFDKMVENFKKNGVISQGREGMKKGKNGGINRMSKDIN
jgi:hypothetical protein